jgi:hypothetical protein
MVTINAVGGCQAKDMIGFARHAPTKPNSEIRLFSSLDGTTALL